MRLCSQGPVPSVTGVIGTNSAVSIALRDETEPKPFGPTLSVERTVRSDTPQ